MYLEHFSLDRPPFRITPDPDLFFPGGGRGAVLDALIYAIRSGEGILKVVGEVGSGKTMLCRMLALRLPPSIEIVYLANPSLSANDIPYSIGTELKLPVKHSDDRLLVMQHLQDYLLKQHAAGRAVVIFIEEAQGMSLETLEEVRLLTNLETHSAKLLQIVLFGQPELDTKLHSRAIRQLRERITHSFRLGAFSAAQTREYLRFRLHAAGGSRPGLIGSAAEWLLFAASGGISRRINILADKAFLAAFADGSYSVQPKHIVRAMRDSEFGFSLLLPRWHVILPFICVPLLLLLVAPLWLQQSFSTVHEESSSKATKATPSLADPKTLKPAPVAPTPAETEHALSLLEQRLLAGRKWLASLHEPCRTIQLMTVPARANNDIERFLTLADQEGALQSIYITPNPSKESAQTWIICYDMFPNVAEARAALEALPYSLRRYQPFIRIISPTAGEMMQPGDSG